MKILSLMLALGIACVSTGTVAADPVDLSGKQGVVDPKDLKKDDPKPPKVEGKAPPPPTSDDKQKKEAEERKEKLEIEKPYEIDRGGIDDANVPYTPPSKK